MEKVSLLFANSSIKALELKSISGERLSRLVDSPDLNHALKVLYEVSYGDGAVIKNPEDFENILYAEEKKLMKSIQELAFDSGAVAAFGLSYDCHNAKALIKAGMQGKSVNPQLLFDMGMIGLSRLAEAVSSTNYMYLPEIIALAFENCQTGTAYGNPRAVEIQLDKAFSAQTEHQLKRCKYPQIREYFQIKTDFANLSALIRSKVYGFSAAEMLLQLLSGGSLAEDRFAEAFLQPLETMSQVFKDTRYYPALKLVATLEGITDFEKASDDMLLGLFWEGRSQIFTPKPFMSYVVSKLNEIKNVRLVLVGKTNRAPVQQIKRRLRAVI